MDELEQQRLARFRQATKDKAVSRTKKQVKRELLLVIVGFLAANWWWLAIAFFILLLALVLWQAVCYVFPACNEILNFSGFYKN